MAHVSAAGHGARRRCPGWSTGCSGNILVDITGNTHRAEICIDKLYSPDSPTGRLGLVEFRALRNAARFRACRLAQQLLIRALISRSCGSEPQDGKFAGPLGHRSCMTASCCRISSGRTFSACSPSFKQCRLSTFEPEWYRGAARVPLPRLRHGSISGGVRPRTAAGARALACAGRGGHDRAAPCATSIQLGRAIAGQGRPVSMEGRHVVTCNGRRMPMTSRPARSGEASLQASASRPGSRPPACIRPFPCTRR